ncbi:g protein-coupled receptor [Anaeramoeba ignava]|uniref:G protein-coupled receptor n=1 Tax=Anaeramoeba ignava TaxID=1746090 RepID=A0A9Q0LRG4_ANAIG|nr:g protein-coupled receptor [Anaeramoeba ignava]
MTNSEEVCTIIGASFGMAGALLIILVYLFFKETRFFYRKLVFILSVYDFIQSISYFLPGHSNKVICRIQFELIAGFGTSSQFWSASISLLSYLKIVKSYPVNFLNKIPKFLHLFMWITVIFFVIFAAFLNDPDDSKTYWCFSTERALLITEYSFIWLYLIICLIFYILTFSKLRKILHAMINQSNLTTPSQINQMWIEFRMSFIPLIYIIIMIPATIKRLRNFIHPSYSEIPTVDILQALLSTSQGFWDFWIFIVFDPEMRKKIRNCCSKKSHHLSLNSSTINENNSENQVQLLDTEKMNLESSLINNSINSSYSD